MDSLFYFASPGHEILRGDLSIAPVVVWYQAPSYSGNKNTLPVLTKCKGGKHGRKSILKAHLFSGAHIGHSLSFSAYPSKHLKVRKVGSSQKEAKQSISTFQNYIVVSRLRISFIYHVLLTYFVILIVKWRQSILRAHCLSCIVCLHQLAVLGFKILETDYEVEWRLPARLRIMCFFHRAALLATMDLIGWTQTEAQGRKVPDQNKI